MAKRWQKPLERKAFDREDEILHAITIAGPLTQQQIKEMTRETAIEMCQMIVGWGEEQDEQDKITLRQIMDEHGLIESDLNSEI